MRVLIGYEASGVVRRAFRAMGHDAWSCDLLPADDESQWHMQCDIWDVAFGDWDMGIFHPECTVFTVAGAWAMKDPDWVRYPGVGYHQRVGADTLVGAARRARYDADVDNWRRLAALPYPKAIENPSPSMVSRSVGRPTQVIQPYEFGHDASKGTGLWLYGLEPLVVWPFMRVSGRWVDGRERWANQTDSGQNKLTPSPERWRDRSRTYEGIANAMAANWSGMI